MVNVNWVVGASRVSYFGAFGRIVQKDAEAESEVGRLGDNVKVRYSYFSYALDVGLLQSHIPNFFNRA
jgi:hypothetical protein